MLVASEPAPTRRKVLGVCAAGRREQSVHQLPAPVTHGLVVGGDHPLVGDPWLESPSPEPSSNVLLRLVHDRENGHAGVRTPIETESRGIMSLDVLALIEEWGPKKAVCVPDQKTDRRGVLVIDNTARGMREVCARRSCTLSAHEVFITETPLVFFFGPDVDLAERYQGAARRLGSQLANSCRCQAGLPHSQHHCDPRYHRRPGQRRGRCLSSEHVLFAIHGQSPGHLHDDLRLVAL